MRISIDIPDLSEEELKDIEVIILKAELDIINREPKFKTSIQKLKIITEQIADIVEQQIINAN